MNYVKEELIKALREQRQPRCPCCGEPLEISQLLSVYSKWQWDKTRMLYIRRNSRQEAAKPWCQHCETRDWDFVESGEEAQRLGLEY